MGNLVDTVLDIKGGAEIQYRTGGGLSWIFSPFYSYEPLCLRPFPPLTPGVLCGLGVPGVGCGGRGYLGALGAGGRERERQR